MAKQIFIKQLKNGQTLDDELFGINIIKRANDKNGKPYIDLELIDKTGTIKGKIWSDNFMGIEQKALQEGKVASITGRVTEFNSHLQINIYALKLVEEFDISDFVSKTEKNIGELFNQLLGVINNIKTPEIKGVLLKLIDLYGEDIKVTPAAKSVHHNYIGGLLEHIIEMLEISEIVLKLYPEADPDIVKAGIIFHDIGKIEELKVDGFQINYTIKGKLLGHISIGALIFAKLSEKILDDKIRLEIEHIILSHHYLLEFGSPVTPKTIEAVIVAKIDDLSSKTRLVQKILKNNEDNASDFAPREFGLEGEVYLPHRE